MARSLDNDPRAERYADESHVCPNCGNDDGERFLVWVTDKNKPRVKCEACGHWGNRREFLPKGTSKKEMAVPGKHLMGKVRDSVRDAMDKVWSPAESAVWQAKAPKYCDNCAKARNLVLATVFMPQSMWDWALDLVQSERREIMLYPAFLRSETVGGRVHYYIMPSPKTEAALALAALENILLWSEEDGGERALAEETVSRLRDAGFVETLRSLADSPEWPDALVIPPQRVSGAYCRRMSREEAEKAGLGWRPEYEADFSDARIHSHVDMGVGHSGTDANSIDANNDVSIVMNHRGSVEARARVTMEECGHRITVPAAFQMYNDAGRSKWIIEGRERAKDTHEAARWGFRQWDDFGT